MTEPTHETPQEAYVRHAEDANRAWKVKAEAFDAEYTRLLLQPEQDQSPAALHSQYMRRRETGRSAWQGKLSDAAATYRERTGETTLPALGWTPAAPEPLPAPGTPPRPQQQVKNRARWFPLAAVLSALVLIAVVSSVIRSSSTPATAGGSSSSDTTPYGSTVEVLYEVEGTASGTNITLQSATGTVQANDKAVPLASKATGKRGMTYTMPRGHFVYLSAQNTGSSGSITCRITVDGTAVSTNTSSGGYAIASCNGTAR